MLVFRVIPTVLLFGFAQMASAGSCPARVPLESQTKHQFFRGTVVGQSTRISEIPSEDLAKDSPTNSLLYQITETTFVVTQDYSGLEDRVRITTKERYHPHSPSMVSNFEETCMGDCPSKFKLGNSYFVAARKSDQGLTASVCQGGYTEAHVEEYLRTGRDPHWSRVEACGATLGKAISFRDKSKYLALEACRADLFGLLSERGEAAYVIANRTAPENCRKDASKAFDEHVQYCRKSYDPSCRATLDRGYEIQSETLLSCTLQHGLYHPKP